MGDPLFWLGLSLLLVAVSLTAVLVVAIPAMRELSRAARSAEKLFDTPGRELPPTLEAIRLTGLEITELTDDVSEGVQNAGRVVKHMDDGITSARQQAKTLHTGTRSLWAGARAAWRVWASPRRQRRSKSSRAVSPGYGSQRRGQIKDVAGPRNISRPPQALQRPRENMPRHPARPEKPASQPHRPTVEMPGRNSGRPIQQKPGHPSGSELPPRPSSLEEPRGKLKPDAPVNRIDSNPNPSGNAPDSAHPPEP